MFTGAHLGITGTIARTLISADPTELMLSTAREA